MRILIIGSPGAGKTTFANALGHILEIPVISMDDEYWQAGWRRPDPAKWEETQTMWSSLPSTIIDGNYASFLPARAKGINYVVLLDTSTPQCIWRIVKRETKRVFGDKLSLPKKVRSDSWYIPQISFEFLNTVVHYRKTTLPGMLRYLEDNLPDCEVLRVGNLQDQKRVFNRLQFECEKRRSHHHGHR